MDASNSNGVCTEDWAVECTSVQHSMISTISMMSHGLPLDVFRGIRQQLLRVRLYTCRASAVVRVQTGKSCRLSFSHENLTTRAQCLMTGPFQSRQNPITRNALQATNTREALLPRSAVNGNAPSEAIDWQYHQSADFVRGKTANRKHKLKKKGRKRCWHQAEEETKRKSKHTNVRSSTCFIVGS
jgi:hypothetical protein